MLVYFDCETKMGRKKNIACLCRRCHSQPAGSPSPSTSVQTFQVIRHQCSALTLRHIKMCIVVQREKFLCANVHHRGINKSILHSTVDTASKLLFFLGGTVYRDATRHQAFLHSTFEAFSSRIESQFLQMVAFRIRTASWLERNIFPVSEQKPRMTTGNFCHPTMSNKERPRCSVNK